MERKIMDAYEHLQEDDRLHTTLNQSEEATDCVVPKGADSRPKSGSLFHKVLVALDSSRAGRRTFECALEFASLHKSALLLLHVLGYEEYGFESPLPSSVVDLDTLIGATALEQYLEARERTRARTIERLSALVEEARKLGVEADFVLLGGSPERAIRRQAEQWGADLIVLGRRGHTGLSELYLGSVSNYVVHNVFCHILVLQGECLTQPDTVQATAE
jgi:nucleotide-binding universal stress UspA family protein